ncbi:MAG: DUF4339 domain-containing protein [Thermoguttaceae bacterium]
MPNYFYTDANGQKQGPVDDQQLQALATQGNITPHTPLETDTGHKGVAGQIPGLKFAAASPVNEGQFWLGWIMAGVIIILLLIIGGMRLCQKKPYDPYEKYYKTGQVSPISGIAQFA